MINAICYYPDRPGSYIIATTANSKKKRYKDIAAALNVTVGYLENKFYFDRWSMKDFILLMELFEPEDDNLKRIADIYRIAEKSENENATEKCE